MAEEDVALVIDDAREAMNKSFDSLKHEISKVRTGRANPILLETVTVDYYGTPTPLKALATLSAPEARLLVVQPFDPGSIEAIERAILKADLGLSPNNDGKLIRLPVPELTEERRRELVKAVKKMGEDHRVGVRGARRDGIAMLKDLEKSKDIAEDESHRAQKKTQEMTDEFTNQIDDLLVAKEQEILTI